MATDLNIIVGVQSGDALRQLANVQKGVQNVGNATSRTTAQLKSHANQYNKTAVATNKFAKGAMQQAGYQVADFAVQLQNGTSFLQAFGQQGSQMLAVFGPLGAVLGGVVAVGAALGTVFFKSAANVKGMKDAMDGVAESIARFKGADNLILENLERPFLQAATAANAYLKDIRAVELETIITKVRNAVGVMTQSFEDGAEKQRAIAQRTQDNLNKLFEKPADERTDADIDLMNTYIDRIEEANLKAREFVKIREKFAMATIADDTTELAQNLIEARNELIEMGYKSEALDKLFNEMMEASGLHNIVLEEQKKLQDEVTDSVKNTDDVLKRLLERVRKDKEPIFDPRDPSYNRIAHQMAIIAEETENASNKTKKLKKSGKDAAEAIKFEMPKATLEIMRMRDAGDMIGGSFENAFMDVIKGTKSVKDAFRTMAAEIIAELYRIFVVKQITGFISSFIADPAMFAGGASGTTAGIRPQLRPRAVGGQVFAGTPYLVGERGPELMIPSSSGNMIPSSQLGGGGGVTVVQNINVSTGVQQTVRTEIKSLMPQIAESAKSAVMDAKRRGGSYGRSFA